MLRNFSGTLGNTAKGLYTRDPVAFIEADNSISRAHKTIVNESNLACWLGVGGGNLSIKLDDSLRRGLDSEQPFESFAALNPHRRQLGAIIT